MFYIVVRMLAHANSSASLRSVHGKRDIKLHPHVFMIAPARNYSTWVPCIST